VEGQVLIRGTEEEKVKARKIIETLISSGLKGLALANFPGFMVSKVAVGQGGDDNRVCTLASQLYKSLLSR